jgi:hypothetical protein
MSNATRRSTWPVCCMGCIDLEPIAGRTACCRYWKAPWDRRWSYPNARSMMSRFSLGVFPRPRPCLSMAANGLRAGPRTVQSRKTTTRVKKNDTPVSTCSSAMTSVVFWRFLLRLLAPGMTIRCSKIGTHPKSYPTMSSIGPIPVFKASAPTYPHCPVIHPRKKPRGKQLDAWDSWCNSLRAHIRIVVEHAIGGVKRYGAIAQVYRNWGADFEDRLTVVASGLWNWHLQQVR